MLGIILTIRGNITIVTMIPIVKPGVKKSIRFFRLSKSGHDYDKNVILNVIAIKNYFLARIQ